MEEEHRIETWDSHHGVTQRALESRDPGVWDRLPKHPRCGLGIFPQFHDLDLVFPFSLSDKHTVEFSRDPAIRNAVAN